MKKRSTLFCALGLGLGLVSLSCKAPVAQAPALDPNDKKPEIVAQDRITPAALAALLAKDAQAATVLNIGIKPLYEDGHIPGAPFAGEGATPAGLKSIEASAKGLPKDKQTVIYCGCCPWDHCPNILPAYKKLKELGFTDLKVLKIDTDFGTDWEKKGYPSEKSKKAKKG